MHPYELSILMSSLEKVKLEQENPSLLQIPYNPSKAPPPPPTSAKQPATMSNRDEIPEEAIEIIDTFRSIVSTSAHNQPGIKEELLELCYKMETVLESPDDFIQKLRAEPTRYTAVKIGIDLGLFEMLGENPITAAALAEKCEADKLLLAS
ncbi:hypothetical protein HYALB_00002590 [Hymenoscyphus albidus]|uniref:Uncharacterized protein n=1 Tax=Hymenoscyphus albidus TaxID=595503 RepID=A0A9N9LR67_9HELO|nr:hypothetical protein HYALB_00002590 [Hymenoscyphus albidus]